MKRRMGIEHIKLLPIFKTRAEFNDRNINIEVRGNLPEYGLIVANHPTIEDSRIWRIALPKAYHLVNYESLKKTPFKKLNEILAVVWSGMIPVYKHEKKLRQRTYNFSSQFLIKNRLLIINPTGHHSASNTVPNPQEINPLGTVKIIQQAKIRHIIPAYLQVSNIDTHRGIISNGSTIKITFGDAIPISDTIINQTIVSNAELSLLTKKISSAWQEIQSKNE